MQAKTFSSGAVAYRPFRAVVDALEGLRLVQHFPGFYDPKAFEWGDGASSGKGRASRFRATPALLNLAGHHRITAGATREHFRRPPPDRVIILKAKSTRVGRSKVKGFELPVPLTAEVQKLAAQICKIDTFLSGVKITGASHEAFVRSFEHGYQPEFRWNKGGRLYSTGDYQSMKDTRRLAMRFDGEPVVEIDIKASYLTILHGKMGVTPEFGADPYAVPGIPREIAKGWLVASVGAEKHLARWPSDQAADYATKTGGRQLRRDHPVNVVREKMVARYPVLRHVGEPGLGWADLMFTESEAIIGAILILIERRIPSLPVHDSLIVPASAERVAVDALEGSFREVAGVDPLIEVNCGSTDEDGPPSPLSYRDRTG
jgi:hypothetical protein